jgi:hypothetical protein
VQRGTHDELMAQEGIYRRIYDLQARIEDELEQELAEQTSRAWEIPVTWEEIWEDETKEEELAYVAL